MGIPVKGSGASGLLFLQFTVKSCTLVTSFLLSLLIDVNDASDTNDADGDLQSYCSYAGDSEVLHKARLAHPPSLLPGTGHPGCCQGLARGLGKLHQGGVTDPRLLSLG